MIPQRQSSDLAAESFLVLRTAFFGERAEPQFYQLRDKRNTQDDPFDVYVHQLLEERLPANTKCLKAPGPLITPAFGHYASTAMLWGAAYSVSGGSRAYRRRRSEKT